MSRGGSIGTVDLPDLLSPVAAVRRNGQFGLPDTPLIGSDIARACSALCAIPNSWGSPRKYCCKLELTERELNLGLPLRRWLLRSTTTTRRNPSNLANAGRHQGDPHSGRH
jgi:hypothetical protein